MKNKATRSIIILMVISWITLLVAQLDSAFVTRRNTQMLFSSEVNKAMNRAVAVMDHEELGKLYNSRMVFDENWSDYLQRLFDSLEYGQSGFHGLKYGTLEVDQYKTLLMSFMHETGYAFSYMDLGFEVMDSIVNDKLTAMGIELPYELGVYNSEAQCLVYETTGRYSDELLEEGVKFNLISISKRGGVRSDYLMIFFPNLNYWMFTKSLLLLIISLLVLALVLYCFVYTIRTIRKQKTLSEEKNDFVNNMTHELKTPISTIALACQTLSDDDVQKNDQMVSTYINIISEENSRLKKLVEEVLKAARLDKGMHSSKLVNIDMHKLLEEVVQMHILTAESKKGVIIMDFKATEYFVYGDRVHIVNAMSNLLDNALKYCDKVPQIYVRTRNLHGELEIRVQDNGLGISKLNQKKVFDEFFRVGTGNIHNVKGHGIGLSYVKKVIEFNRGTINIESELHCGAIFVITLPLIKNQNKAK